MVVCRRILEEDRHDHYSVEARPDKVQGHSRRLMSHFSRSRASDMKPGRANPKHLKLLPASVFESMEQKRRRLRPDLYPDDFNNGGDGAPAKACTPSPPGSAPHGETAEPAAMGLSGIALQFKTSGT